MTPAQFEARWRRDLDHAEATLLREGEVAPLFAVVAADGRNGVLAADFSGDEAKKRSLDIVRLAAVAVDAQAVFMRMESWVVSGEPLPAGVSPGQSDRRVEALVVAAVARLPGRLETRISLREIVRGDDGRPAGMREIAASRDASGGLAGPMFELLPAEPPTAAQRALAEAMLARLGDGAGG